MAPGQFTARRLAQLGHRQTIQLTALQGTTHSVHHRTTKSQQNQRQRPPAGPPLAFSPLPLPWQAEPKQKLQHEQKGQRKGGKKKKTETVLQVKS